MTELNRRAFLGAAAGTAAGAPLLGEPAGAGPRRAPPRAAREPHAEPPHNLSVQPDRHAVLEAPRKTSVAADVDVLVVGGGPAGVGAALAAGREGARTLVVERHGMLGGVWTAGLLNPFFEFAGRGWLVAELIRRLKEAGAWKRWKFSACFDTEAMKRLLETMMAEAGVGLWYYSFAADTIVEEGRVRGAIVESKSGREAILAKVVVDCTGDGDIAARAGVPYHLGRMSDGLCQPMTLMFEVEGVRDFHQKGSQHLYDLLAQAIERHGLDVELPFSPTRTGTPWIIHVPRPDAAVVQATHVYRINPLDTRQLTQATIEGRRQAHELLAVMKHIAQLEGIRVTQTAAAIGVREARRICGHYTLGLEDLRRGRAFEDGIVAGKFGVDIHEITRGAPRSPAQRTRVRPYEIPFRCLLPKAVRGLLVAGRCISGTHEAHASYRVTGTCMGMGQAAGLAAAMAATQGELPDQIDGSALREALLRRGVGLLKG